VFAVRGFVMQELWFTPVDSSLAPWCRAYLLLQQWVS